MSLTNAFFYAFDSGEVAVPDSNWKRVLAIDTSKASAITFGIDIAVTVGAVNLMITRASIPGGQHVPLVSDFTKIGRAIQVATIGNPAANFVAAGTVNQPGAGDFLAVNVDTSGCCELGVYARAVAGPAVVRAYGQVPSLEW